MTCFFLRFALVSGMGQGSWVVCGVGLPLGSEMGRGSGGLLEGFRFGARLIVGGGRGGRRIGAWAEAEGFPPRLTVAALDLEPVRSRYRWVRYCGTHYCANTVTN